MPVQVRGARWRQGLALSVGLLALSGCALQVGPGASGGVSAPATASPSAAATATATVPPAQSPVAGGTCQPAQLTLAFVTTTSAAGHVLQVYRFTNTSALVCTLYGFPGAQMYDSAHHPIPTKVSWQTSSYMWANLPKQLVTLQPGGVAYFAVSWSDAPLGTETTCPSASILAATPPNDFSTIETQAQIDACNGGILIISPVQTNEPPV